MEQELRIEQRRIQAAIQKAQAELFQVRQAQQQLRAREAQLEDQLLRGSGALETIEYLTGRLSLQVAESPEKPQPPEA